MPKSIEGVMHEFKHGELHSGSKHGPVVRNRKQAIAIAMSEQRQKKGKKMKSTVYGSGPFSASEKTKGYKVLCDASQLMQMDESKTDMKEVLAKRRLPGHLRRSQSTKGSY